MTKAIVLGPRTYANPLNHLIGETNVDVVPLYTEGVDYSKYDIVQFTGGEDVSPYLYKAEPHTYTQFNPRRDAWEIEQFERAQQEGCVMAGICRGSQFLNVMCGGTLHQHINGHGLVGMHEITARGLYPWKRWRACGVG